MALWIDQTIRPPQDATVEVNTTPTGDVEVAVVLPESAGSVAVILTVPQALELVRNANRALGVTA